MVAFVLCKDHSLPGSRLKAASSKSRFERNTMGHEMYLFHVETWCSVAECC